jgi:hypothetical protein
VLFILLGIVKKNGILINNFAIARQKEGMIKEKLSIYTYGEVLSAHSDKVSYSNRTRTFGTRMEYRRSSWATSALMHKHQVLDKIPFSALDIEKDPSSFIYRCPPENTPDALEQFFSGNYEVFLAIIFNEVVNLIENGKFDIILSHLSPARKNDVCVSSMKLCAGHRIQSAYCLVDKYMRWPPALGSGVRISPELMSRV